MKIKQGLLATLVTASCGLFTPLSHAVNIDITGKVIASPCEVNGGNETLSIDLEILFGPEIFLNQAAAVNGKPQILSLFAPLRPDSLM